MQINNTNWFPGHMAKAKRQIKENIKLVDAVVEILDARIPYSSRNPDIKDIVLDKPSLIVLNKSDLSDKIYTEEWLKYYRNNGINAISMECNTGRGIDKFIESINKIMEEKLTKWRSKGMVGRSIKVMVIGEPNTGKSSLINRLAKGNRVKTENKPGVTRGNQWITAADGIQILDTPGILPPKITGVNTQNNLAFTGAIKDDILDLERISFDFLDFMCKNYPNKIIDRYKLNLNDFSDIPLHEVMNLIGKSRGFLVSGGEIDVERTSKMLITEFRSGKLGRITLEKPDKI